MSASDRFCLVTACETCALPCKIGNKSTINTTTRIFLSCRTLVYALLRFGSLTVRKQILGFKALQRHGWSVRNGTGRGHLFGRRQPLTVENTQVATIRVIAMSMELLPHHAAIYTPCPSAREQRWQANADQCKIRICLEWLNCVTHAGNNATGPTHPQAVDLLKHTTPSSIPHPHQCRLTSWSTCEKISHAIKLGSHER